MSNGPDRKALSPVSSSARAAPRALLVVVAYLGFVSLALPDAAHGVSWPFVREAFGLPQSGLGLVMAGTASGFFVSSFFAGRLLEAFGVGRLLAGSTGLVAAALVAVAAAPAFPVFLAAAPLVGLGSGAIDSGLNAYAAKRFSARHMNWLHAAFGFGAACGPLLMTGAILATDTWRLGYAAIAVIMGAMALLFLSTRGLWRADAGEPIAAEGAPPQTRVTTRGALANPLVQLQVAMFCLYVGVEFGAGLWIFAVLTEGRGLSVELAGTMTGLFWGGLFVGRVAFGLFADRIGEDRSVRLGLLGMAVGAAAFAFAPTALSLAGIVLLGLACAPIFPMLMSRTPARLGEALTAHAVGFQVSAAMLGGVIFPALGGVLADVLSLEAIPVMLVATVLALIALNAVLERRTA
ncbi:MFS transporter [Salinarimonas ramus]|uniref:MFS transporter n=1 Tax=Salinarimonas ramus TaxID=690164 RepID=A0A917Q476_9HYPH|nr:MFS transporter [Salinarimonas ramus]GGK21497.1 MFS transporter [Salinarimonas ramus]